MKLILLSLSVAILIVFILIPLIVCYILSGKIKIKNLKKVYHLLFKD